MNKHDINEFLQIEVDVPEIVQTKADEAFRQIHHQSETTEHPIEDYKAGKRPSNKKRLLFVAVAVLVMGTTIVAAASHIRSRSLSEGLHATPKQVETLKENEMTVFVGQSVTDQNITVTAIQSITDNYFTHIALKVEGYDVPAGTQPDFEHVKIMVDGDDEVSWNASFYNGLLSDDSGSAIKADGSPAEFDENGCLIENYVMDDGSLEYQITLANTQEKGYFYNKNIHIELQNLGIVAKAEYTPDLEGNWNFDWELSGNECVEEYEPNAALGDTGIIVTKAEITPISLYTELDFPREEIVETTLDENGVETEYTTYTEPPQLMGVKMKDGTLYPLIYLGPGSLGYLDETSNRYMISFAIDRILDEKQVESLLFIKSYPEGDEEAFTIDNFYEVPLS